MWLIPLGFFFVFGTISFLLRRYLAQKLPHDNRLVNLVFYVVFLLPAGIALGLFFPHKHLIPSPEAAILLLAASLVWPIYFMASFRAAKDMDAGVLSMITDASAIVTLLVAYVVMHERLGIPQIIGVLCLVASGTITIWPTIGEHGRTKTSGIWESLLVVSTMGIGVVIDKLAMQKAGLSLYFLYAWSLQAIWMALIAYRDWERLSRFMSRKNNYREAVLVYGAVGVLRSLVFTLALVLSVSPTIMTAGTNFLSITVIAAAYIFLRERQHLSYKIAGAIVGLVGLFFISN